MTYLIAAANVIVEGDALQQRLTAAEQRNGLVLPSNQEVSLLVWNVHLKAQSIPGVSVFNAAEMSAAALMEMIKDLNS